MQQAAFTVVAGAVAAVEATLDDIKRVLKIEAVSVVAGEVEKATVSVETTTVPPSAE